MKQRTIKETTIIEGLGLQTGEKVTMKIKSAPADSGVSFVRVDLPDRPAINLKTFDPGASSAAIRRTVLGSGPLQVQTTEHFLAALAGLSIDNISVEMDNVELPGLDGSALEYANYFKKAGIIDQSAEKKFFKIDQPVWCEENDSFLAVFPAENFSVSYTLSYANSAIGTQYRSIILDRQDVFEKEIAPARTFCLQEEAMELIKRGLGKGANYENTLVMGNDGPINNKLRFADEPVRHKILDLVGDLYLAGMPLQGHVVAIKSGHKLNMELVAKLKKGK